MRHPNRNNGACSDKVREVNGEASLASHLFQSHKNGKSHAKIARSLEGIGEGLDAMGRATLIIEGDGSIRWLSPLAREWLAEFFSGASPPGKLPPVLKRGLIESVRTVARKTAVSSEFTVSSTSGYRFVARWGKAADGSFTLFLVRERMIIDTATAGRFELTPREAEILHWISEARSNQEITAILGVSLRTTEKHIENLFKKLKVRSRVEAQRLGWELRRA